MVFLFGEACFNRTTKPHQLQMCKQNEKARQKTYSQKKHVIF